MKWTATLDQLATWVNEIRAAARIEEATDIKTTQMSETSGVQVVVTFKNGNKASIIRNPLIRMPGYEIAPIVPEGCTPDAMAICGGFDTYRGGLDVKELREMVEKIGRAR